MYALMMKTLNPEQTVNSDFYWIERLYHTSNSPGIVSSDDHLYRSWTHYYINKKHRHEYHVTVTILHKTMNEFYKTEIFTLPYRWQSLWKLQFVTSHG